MEGSTNSIVEVINTTFGEISDNMMTAVSAVLPYALTVAGAILVIMLGWKLFKRLTK